MVLATPARPEGVLLAVWRRPAGRCTTCTSFQVKHVGSSLSAAVWLSGGNPADLTLEA